MKKSLTNEMVDERLKLKKIKRLDNYINNKTAINFQCLICERVWKGAPNHIIHEKSGCPYCADTTLTNEIVDKRLEGRSIKRIDNYITQRVKITFECLKCTNRWLVIPDSILHKNAGCPKCGDRTLTNEIIDERLQNRNIKRLDDYINNSTKIRFLCLKNECEFEWMARTHDIFDKQSGCPKCAARLKSLSDKDVDKKLEGRLIARLDKYINGRKKIYFQCLLCQFKWKALPDSIINGGSGCPKCCIGKSEKIILSVLEKHNIVFSFQKKIKDIIISSYNYRVDFYIPSLNLIIEYNGEQHYRPVCFGGCSEVKAKENLKRQIKRDNKIKKICKDNKINLEWIDGRKYKNKKIEIYVLAILKKYKVID